MDLAVSNVIVGSISPSLYNNNFLFIEILGPNSIIRPFDKIWTFLKKMLSVNSFFSPFYNFFESDGEKFVTNKIFSAINYKYI